MENSWKAYLCALLAVTLWGFSFVWENYLITSNINILCFSFERMLLASLILWGIGVGFSKIESVRLKDFKWFVFLAFGEPFIYFIGENYGMKLLGSPVITAVIITMIPVFCLFAERIFYKTPLTLLKTLGVVIAVPGVYLVVANGVGGGGINYYGLLLLLLAVIGSILYSFMVMKVTKLGYNILTVVTWQFTLGALMFLPLFLMFGLKGLDSLYFSFKVQANIFALALFCSCLCFSLWCFVTAKLGIVRSNIFSVLIPAVSAIVAHLYGQESITVVKMLGIFVAATGIVLVQWKKEK